MSDPATKAPARRLGLPDALAAISLAIGYVAWLVRTVKDLGYARDEGFYFTAAASYGRWFEMLFKDRHAALEPRFVDGAFGYNHEHPVLIKSLFALSNMFLQKKLHLFAMEGTSYRFPAMVLGGVLIGVVYLWGAEVKSRVAGFSAAVLLAAMPHFFFNAHLACFDVPIAAMWTLAAYAYWRALRDGGIVMPLLAGVCFGLALDTKLNAWFLPIAFVAHLIACESWSGLARTRLGAVLRALPRPWVARRRVLAALAAVALVGPLVCYALWPWIWHDTVPRVREYVLFHLNHEYYNMEFLGKNYWAPPMPRGYAWVMTLASVPAITLALAAAGFVMRARVWFGGRREGEALDPAGTDMLWVVAVLVNYSPWLRTVTPIFGGTKHWMTAYPFLALFAGVGVDAVVRVVRGELFRLRRRARALRVLAASPEAAALLVGAAVTAAPLVETAHANPWGLSSYTPLVGGAAGGASLGLNRTFWGYATGAVAGFLDREAPRGGSVYLHDTARPAWEMLLRDGRVRGDLRGVGSPVGADLGVYQHELHMLGHEYQSWIAFGTASPALVAGLDGVPVIMVYEQARLRRH